MSGMENNICERNMNPDDMYSKVLFFKLRAWRPPQERKTWGSNPACDGIFPGRVIPVTSKSALQWLPCQAPGMIGSALGLVGPVSVYCDWVR